MKLKDVYITLGEDGEVKVLPRSAGKPERFVYEDGNDPEKIRFLFGMLGHVVDDQESFDELMKIEEFREIRDAHRLKKMRLGLDPKKVGMTSNKLYTLLEEQLKSAAEKGMTETAIKQWYRGLVAERKAA